MKRMILSDTDINVMENYKAGQCIILNHESIQDVSTQYFEFIKITSVTPRYVTFSRYVNRHGYIGCVTSYIKRSHSNFLKLYAGDGTYCTFDSEEDMLDSLNVQPKVMDIQVGQVYCSKSTEPGDENIYFTKVGAIDDDTVKFATYHYTTYRFSPYVCAYSLGERNVGAFMVRHNDDLVFDSLQSFVDEFDLDMNKIKRARYSI